MNNNSNEHSHCESCRYFTHVAVIHEQDKAYGRCHRYPPGYTNSNAGDKLHHWEQPLVHVHGWCGEHNPAADPAKK